LLAPLFGEHDEHLALIEHRLGVAITPRGNRISVKGPQIARDNAQMVLTTLYERVRRGLEVTRGDVEGAIRMNLSSGGNDLAADESAVRTRRKLVTPRTPMQKAYVTAIRKHELVFGTGPAGTGKTYLAVACAAASLMNGEVDRIVLSRPAVEAGERLGFLPGTLYEKIDPYLRPLYDALHDMIDPDSIPRLMASGTIEVAPLAYMRGRTLNDAFIILDEAQNTSPEQMKMFLTRLGFGSKVVVTGDVTQIDLPAGTKSGLKIVQEILDGIEDLQFCFLTSHDVVRHKLVGRIVDAYNRWDARNGDTARPVRAAGRQSGRRRGR
jgi:phosphate starvation-inducible protein PhoH and related proteins